MPSEPVSIDTQHNDMVHDAQLDYYGIKLATCSSDKTVKVFNVAKDQEVSHVITLGGHEGPVYEVAWAHPKFGSILASSSFDGSVLLHRETHPSGSWDLVHAHRMHESSVNSISYAPHEYGLILAAGSSDGKVSVITHKEDDSWEVAHFQDNKLGVNSVSFAPYSSNPDKKEMRLVVGGCDNRVRFWTLNSETNEWEQDDFDSSKTEIFHSDWVRDVAWAPSVGSESIVASCSEDKTVIIWTQSEGSGSGWTPKLLNSFEDPVWRVSWSLTGNILAVSSGDNKITLWKATLDGKWVEVEQEASSFSQQ